MSILSLINKETRFREPRKWSNRELKKISSRLPFVNSVVNVSAWKDQDKEGKTYQEGYFASASDYWITNWKPEAFGYQGGLEKEIYLDLENNLPAELRAKFDIVFNHTTLEHVFDVQKAFSNLCEMAKDSVVIVVPFLQEQHGSYGDYWRFTPWCIKRLFEQNGLALAYINVNDGPVDSIYVFAVGVKEQETYKLIYDTPGNCADHVEKMLVGQAFCEKKNWMVKFIERLIEHFRK